MWTLHPPSTSSETATRLCGMEFTLNTRLDLLGNFFSQSFRDSEVYLCTLDRVFREMLDSWTSAILQWASFPNGKVNTAQSRCAVGLFVFGRLAQPGGSS